MLKKCRSDAVIILRSHAFNESQPLNFNRTLEILTIYFILFSHLKFKLLIKIGQSKSIECMNALNFRQHKI